MHRNSVAVTSVDEPYIPLISGMQYQVAAIDQLPEAEVKMQSRANLPVGYETQIRHCRGLAIDCSNAMDTRYNKVTRRGCSGWPYGIFVHLKCS